VWRENEYDVFDIPYGAIVSVPVGSNPPALPVELRFFRFRLGCTSFGGGRYTCDNVEDTPGYIPPPQAVIKIPFTSQYFDKDPDAGGSRTASWQVDDPRINYDWRFWQPVSTATLGRGIGSGRNSVATYDQPGKDGTYLIHVPQVIYRGTYWEYLPMRGLQDFGFLLFDENRPWETIRLAGPDAMPVFEFFSESTNGVPAQVGRINLNTPDEDALACAFLNATVFDFTNSLSETRVTLNAQPAKALAGLFTASDENWTNRVDAFSSITYQDLRTAVPGLATKWVCDDVIGRSYHLLGTRQNLFTILLAAQTGESEGGLFESRSEARAVAVVWRDPYPDPVDDTHRCFVRLFRMLDE
jgi:hypothetical protein